MNALDKARQNPIALLKKYVNAPAVQERLKDMLGNRASAFSNSIINVVNGNSGLQKIATQNPESIMKAAMVSASMNLPIDPALGFSAIVPYGGKDPTAQWQIMYKGVIQLCIRSGQYETIHDTEIYVDELESYNPITGEVKFRDLTEYKLRPKHDFGDVAGFYCHFKLLKGFRASLFMTKDEVMEHGKRFSKAYQWDLKKGDRSSLWSTDPIAMGRKTVILQLLKRYGIMSIEMQDAVSQDYESDDVTSRHVDSSVIPEGTQDTESRASVSDREGRAQQEPKQAQTAKQEPAPPKKPVQEAQSEWDKQKREQEAAKAAIDAQIEAKRRQPKKQQKQEAQQADQKPDEPEQQPPDPEPESPEQARAELAQAFDNPEEPKPPAPDTDDGQSEGPKPGDRLCGNDKCRNYNKPTDTATNRRSGQEYCAECRSYNLIIVPEDAGHATSDDPGEGAEWIDHLYVCTNCDEGSRGFDKPILDDRSDPVKHMCPYCRHQRHVVAVADMKAQMGIE